MDRPKGFGGSSRPKSWNRKKSQRNVRFGSSAEKTTKGESENEKKEFRGFSPVNRRRKTATVSLGALLALAAVSVLLVFSPAFHLKKIQLEGETQLSVAELEPLFKDLYGVPLAFLNDETVAETLAQIKIIQAFDTRISPPSTLVLRIVERKPLGVFYSGERFDLVDAAGVILDSKANLPDDFPQILVEPNPESSSFRAVTRVLSAVPDQLLAQVNAITASTLDDVRFTVRDSSHEVVWGSSDRSIEKAAALRASLIALEGLGSRIIDVSTPESVVVREQ